MTALEYMEKQLKKCRENYSREVERGASSEVLNNIIKKIGYYGEAVEALRRKDDAPEK